MDDGGFRLSPESSCVLVLSPTFFGPRSFIGFAVRADLTDSTGFTARDDFTGCVGLIFLLGLSSVPAFRLLEDISNERARCLLSFHALYSIPSSKDALVLSG